MSKYLGIVELNAVLRKAVVAEVGDTLVAESIDGMGFRAFTYMPLPAGSKLPAYRNFRVLPSTSLKADAVQAAELAVRV